MTFWTTYFLCPYGLDLDLRRDSLVMTGACLSSSEES